MMEKAHADLVNTQIAACIATVLSLVHGHLFLPVLSCIVLASLKIYCTLTNEDYDGGLVESWLKFSEDREGALNEVSI